jgi:hypothetical protein
VPEFGLVVLVLRAVRTVTLAFVLGKRDGVRTAWDAQDAAIGKGVDVNGVRCASVVGCRASLLGSVGARASGSGGSGRRGGSGCGRGTMHLDES